MKLLLPTEVLVDVEVTKVIAEAENGFFCLLPRHVDFVAALVPGVLYYTTTDGGELFAAIDEGMLVKCGHQVLVSVLNATLGTDLAALQSTVAQSFRAIDEEERHARTALGRLEAATLKGLYELERERHG
jgi:F-type H+-transporting ATPase subunit epsilon